MRIRHMIVETATYYNTMMITKFNRFYIKVQASIPSNTYVVSGTVETKRLEELLPGILNQLGPESMGRLREYATNTMDKKDNGDDDEEDDDDVPDLVENFEEAAAK